MQNARLSGGMTLLVPPVPGVRPVQPPVQPGVPSPVAGPAPVAESARACSCYSVSRGMHIGDPRLYQF